MFYDVFISLCKKNGITQTKACSDLGYTRQVVDRWRLRGSSPRSDKLQDIADYFGVSIPYLLGKEEEKPIVNNDEEMCTLYERLISLCAERNITGSKMCTDIGISKSTLSDLKAGRKKSVNAETAKKMASYLNVPVGYLLGEEEEKPLVNNDEELTDFLEAVRDDPDMRMLFSVTKGATKKDIQAAIAIIQMLKSRDRGDG